MSVLSGALAAGLVIPLTGLVGVGTQKVSDAVESLPQELTTEPLQVRSRIFAADGSLIATLFAQNRVPVPLNRVSRVMRQAIVAIEDARFYEHGALDAKGTVRALIRNQTEGSVQQGGSSISQQYVKMSLVEKAATAEQRAAATAVTYQRKLTELRYAIALEKELSKDQILERYLNLANFGDGTYGVEAAAQHYFRTTAAKLTLPQAALLAGLVKNPTGYDPTNDAKRAKDRRDVVLRRMEELGVITAEQADDAIRTPVFDPKKVRKVPNGCAGARYPFYCAYVVSKLLQNPALGATPKEREHYLKTGGLSVTTSLDPRIQAAAQASINEYTSPRDTAVAAITVIEPGTGVVKGMAQSRPYGNGRYQTAYNYNVEKSYAGGYGGFQNGSTMKAFTIAAAIAKGYPIDYRINSPAQIDLSGQPFRTCKGYTKDPDYRPRNSTTSGDLTMVEAARASTNTYFLQLSQRTGLCAPATMAAKLGLYNAQSLGALDQVVSFTLGVGYVTPLMLSNAYATFAARGKYCMPVLVTSVRDKSGRPISTTSPRCRQVIAPQVADGVNRVLSAVMEPGGTGGRLTFGRWDLAGKTGTIQDNRAVWYAGYAPNLAAASVVADANLPYTDLMYGHTLGGRDIADPTGSGTAGPLWKTAMERAMRGLPLRRFTPPPAKILGGENTEPPAGNDASR
ncbi:transglycosylase domain-containing protein [Kribbella flavida]|uniref:transglycosylase domain-containing protein n=1 Tax=Kribbella flavida TaxID=182640 RepID=UPI00019BFA96|nr:transglycosylase domain-containing protein [Kribbella flavida]